MWNPILDGALAEAAREASENLADSLRAGSAPSLQGLDARGFSSFLGGLCAKSLFFAYLAKVSGRSEDEEAAEHFLAAAADALADAPHVAPKLYDGAVGVAWTLRHVSGLWGLEDGEMTASVDEFLVEEVARRPWSGPYDLMEGLVGWGVYGLECGHGPLLEGVLARLEELAERRGDELMWWTAPELTFRELYPSGYYNLGMAHGLAGVIAFLAMSLRAGVLPHQTKRLLTGAVNALLARRLSEGPKVFPWALSPGNPPISLGRDPGWAYADGAYGAALLLAGRAAGVPGWEAEGLAAARAEAHQLEQFPLRNPGIGYGPAGYAHVFNRLHHATGEELFREAAGRCIRMLLDMRVPGAGIGGFQSVQLDGSRHGDERFLGGATGIGLVLLAATTSIEPGWDRLLLLSEPAARQPASSAY